MSHKNEDDIKELSALKEMAAAYAEIAALRMNKKREVVLYTRQFLAELDKLFGDIRNAYVRMYRKHDAGATLLSHNGKTVAVLLSANTKLYGDLIKRTYDVFVDDVINQKSEATILGRAGMQIFETEHPHHPCTYFDFPDEAIDRQALAKVMKHLVPYEQIHVYYGKFVNVLRQEPDKYTIAASLSIADDPDIRVTPYLFEPTIEAILQYFEGQIFGTMMTQAVAEAQLGKYAARLTAMDRAGVRITEKLKKAKQQALMEKHYWLNKKMIDGLTAKHLWFSRARQNQLN